MLVLPRTPVDGQVKPEDYKKANKIRKRFANPQINELYSEFLWS
jgi:hypothetical protein